VQDKTPAKIHQCQVDGCSYSSDKPCYLQRHQRLTHAATRVKCPECARTFKNVKSLAEHSKKHLPPQLRNLLQCDKCACALPTRQQLRLHQAYHHGAERPHACAHCAKRFVTAHLLAQHVAVRHAPPESRRFLCCECGHAAATAALLKTHAAMHAPERAHVCTHPGCLYASRHRSALRSHVRDVHNAQVHACADCGVQVKTLKALRGHRRRFHETQTTPPKRYLCTVCPKTFPSAEVLRQHMLQHEDARAFECDLCKKRFNNRLSLRIHVAAHFRNETHACHLCPKVYSTKGSLTEHLRRHQGEKRHCCPHCPQRFMHYSTFKRHRLKHETGQIDATNGVDDN
jgi:KRAB domain-containing zinc finger protein